MRAVRAVADVVLALGFAVILGVGVMVAVVSTALFGFSPEGPDAS